MNFVSLQNATKHMLLCYITTSTDINITMVGFGPCFNDDGNFDFDSYLLSRGQRRREEKDDDVEVNDEDDEAIQIPKL